MSQKIKVLHLTTDSGIAGAERLLHWLARYYDRKNFELAFCTLKPRGELHRLLESEGMEAHSLEMTSSFKIFSAAKRLNSLMEAFKPEILHTHLLLSGLLGQWVHYQKQVKLLLHTRHYGDYYRWSGEVGMRWIDEALMRSSPRLVAISKAVEHVLVEEMGITRAKVEQIYNGVDVDSLLREPRPPLDEGIVGELEKTHRPRIGLVGRYDLCKGHDLLVAAAPAILKTLPEASFLFVGEGEKRRAIEAAVKRNSLEAHFCFLGVVKELATLLQKLDLLVVPSRTEGFGLIACEAMALGVPVVVSRVEALPEIVEHEVSGLLFERDDVQGLARQVIRLLQDQNLRTNCIKNAREKVLQRFDVHLMVRHLQDLYRKMVNEAFS